MSELDEKKESYNLCKSKAKIVRMTEEAPELPALKEAGSILQAGGLVAFPTETVYGLGGNALDPEASKKIYAAKGRPSDNPLIIHIARLESLKEVTKNVPEAAVRLANKYWPGPLTMIFEKSEKVPLATTGGLDSVAVRLPSSRIARELIECAGGFVAAPSANTSGRPSPTNAEHVAEDLGDRIDMIVDGGAVPIGLESTIVDFTVDPPTILRPGYVNEAMLEEVLGEVATDPGLTGENLEIHPKAPGMKYRHYAPKAELQIIEGEQAAVAERIRALTNELRSKGIRVAILCAEESKDQYPPEITYPIGSVREEETIAKHLYDALRKMDAEGIEAVFSESYNTPRMGQAIMNRLIKAAGHKIIYV